jgi:hypothetical protein
MVDGLGVSGLSLIWNCSVAVERLIRLKAVAACFGW